ncbi:ATP-binding cassette domain-containing protein [Oligoflexaceae bacterium]|nr:ATP-binding cassette domain-containing protein [Oligoflexaceae bacterium]
MSLFSLQNLEADYAIESRRIKILNGISFKVESGEFLAIEGPSGSGKSTLLHILAGLKNRSAGFLDFLGQSMPNEENELASLRNRYFGFVFQDFHLIPHYSVLENVLLPSLYNSDKSQDYRNRAANLLDDLGLNGLGNRKPTQLSGGQQQRVAIARALLLSPRVIFADEPTGALDSETASEVMQLLTKLNADGHTIIIVTHDRKIAEQCSRRIHLSDGNIVSDTICNDKKVEHVKPTGHSPLTDRAQDLRGYRAIFVTALQSLLRYKMRSILSVLGLCIGIMSLLIMMTIGEFTKNKILESYKDLGANQLNVSGYSNWRHDSSKDGLKYTKFLEFNFNRDILPLYKVFKEIKLIAPFIRSWNNKAQFGGEVANEISLIGTTPEYFTIEKRTAISGKLMNHHHLLLRQNICHIGMKVAKSVFKKTDPIGQTLYLTADDRQFPCRVSAVLSKRGSKSDWFDPDNMVVLPLSYLKLFLSTWSARIQNFKIESKQNADLDKLSRGLKNYFFSKYGKSINFHINSDDLLLANLKKFILFFNILLLVIAAVTLGAGGASITNLMLISLAERVREIGIRKAYGATPRILVLQLLTEGLIISFISGVLGIAFGFCLYQFGLYMASEFSDKIKYEVVIYQDAFIISVISILVIGLLSSFFPAAKAQKIETVDALKSH